jgi:hypothetical protein
MEWTTCYSPQFTLKKIDNALSRAPHSDWKNKVPDFSFENSFSTYLHLENTLSTLSNQSMTSKKCKKLPQNPKSTRTKNLLELKYVFLGSFKVKRKKNILFELLSSHRTIWHKNQLFWWLESSLRQLSLFTLKSNEPYYLFHEKIIEK